MNKSTEAVATRRAFLSLLACASVGARAADPAFVSPDRLETYNRRQAARAQEVLSRGPTRAERQEVPAFLRDGTCTVAALYTLFPRGDEGSFAHVARHLHGKKLLQPRGMMIGDILHVLSELQMPATQIARRDVDFGQIALALDEGKAVFLAGTTLDLVGVQLDPGESIPVSERNRLRGMGHVIRITALRRTSTGEVSHMSVYDVNRDHTAWVTVAQLDELNRRMPWNLGLSGAIITNAPVPY